MLFHRVTVSKPSPPVEKLMVWTPYQRRWINEASRQVIAVKAAQIGYSTATAAWTIWRCCERDNHLVVILSASEAQSKEIINRAKRLVNGFKGVEAHLSEGFFHRTETLQHTLSFSNGSRVIALSSNPDTARGYSGDCVLDEFAYHADSDAIFRVAYRQITRGFKLRTLSTPNGQQGRFYQIAKKLGLVNGAPSSQPLYHENWAGHWCDAALAAAEGFQLNLEELRRGCDSDTWEQEYCCSFLANDSLWIPPELLAQAIDAGAHDGYPETGDLYAGWDIARNRDLSVLWFNQLVGDVSWTRGILVFKNMPTPEQLKQVRLLVPAIRRLTIDKSGMGLSICETLEREFPGRVEGVQFTQPVKEVLAVHAKRRLEEHKVRLPDSPMVQAAFRSVRKNHHAHGIAAV